MKQFNLRKYYGKLSKDQKDNFRNEILKVIASFKQKSKPINIWNQMLFKSVVPRKYRHTICKLVGKDYFELWEN